MYQYISCLLEVLIILQAAFVFSIKALLKFLTPVKPKSLKNQVILVHKTHCSHNVKAA